jgi:signal transduction histidine kinase
MVAATIVTERHAHGHEQPSSIAGQYAYLSLALPLSAAGGLIRAKRPGNRFAGLLVTAGLAIAADQLTWYLLLYSRTHGSAPAWLTGWLSDWLWVVPPATLLLGLLTFPDGHLPGPGWRPLAGLTGVWTAALALLAALGGGVYNYDAHYRAFPLPAGAARALHTALGLLFALFPVLLCAVTVALFVRFRRARDEERAQLRFLAVAASVIAGIWTLPPVHDSGSWARALANLAMWTIPVAVAVAVLRYRLFEIDQLVSRALRYAALTAGVAAAYIAVVTLLHEVLQVESGFWTAAAGSAAVAALSAPLRDRVDRTIDRFLYGQRAEPFAVVTRLGRRLESALPADRVLPTIAGTLAESFKLPFVAVELYRDGAYETAYQHGTPTGEPARFPLTCRGESLGRLVVGPRAPGETFSRREQNLLRELARHAGVAVYAARLTADLQRSRERLVTAQEEERRRVRRDLHDGLGPALAGMTFEIAAAERALPARPARAAELLSAVREQMRDAADDVRRLVDGLRPPALDELGLVEALRECRARVGDLAVAVESAQPLPPLPATVEVAAYRIASEAITNVARHADARRCTIRLRLDDALHLEITDDGRGLPGQPRPGVGLASMRERAAELGGTCTAENIDGSGTRISVRLPLAGARA